MVLKIFALLLLACVAIQASPFHHHGHEDHGSHGGATSHASVNLVSHDDGHEDHGHGHGHGHGHEGHDHHDSHAEYDFNYGVKDPKTGDIKGHSESRHGHKVTGHYELIDADGHKRTVHYTADKHKGFEAQVHREKTHHHVPVHHGHSGYEGGHVDFEEYSSSSHGHDFGHDYGHEHGGHGHGHGSSTHGFSLKQEHGH
ncbi:histidine-rich glycoprotein, partial [Scaptodrosophila lebanonensis]|uniref:Histidine-rich glycoprotein n=1 Tax=Drosophila lebanonensis TaxID=7225 RepID=A0A6J2TML7_DROLE